MTFLTGNTTSTTGKTKDLSEKAKIVTGNPKGATGVVDNETRSTKKVTGEG